MGISKSSRVILNYPPASSVWHLPAGIAQLTSILRSQGHEVLQFCGHISGLEKVLRDQGGLSIDNALSCVRDPKATINDKYEARGIFEKVSSSVKTSDKFKVERNNVLYVSEYYDGTVEGLINALKYRERNLWYSYFEQVELPIAKDFRPHIYGISIADERQLIPGVILGSLIKETSPDTIVVLGGNLWSRVSDAFGHPEFYRILRLFDGIVYSEGFQPLKELAVTRKISTTPGAVWFDGEKVVINPVLKTPTQFETLPTPTFDGMARQWSPDFVPQLYTMSNCPMKCKFCAISAASDTFLKGLRMMSPEKIVDVMMDIGASRFEISDEVFTINRQLSVGEELRKRGYSATWNSYLTVTNDLLKPELCIKLYEAGCRGVQLGLESLSRETLVEEKKAWNRPENYGRILKNLSETGIQVHVFLIVGFPEEELISNLRWLPFLEEHGENILTIKSGRYRLTKRSPEEMQNTHSRFIKPIEDGKPFHLNKNFRYIDRSFTRNRIEAIRDLHEQACREHWAYSVTSTLPWWANRGRHSIEELRKMAKLLPKEPDVDHLDKALSKAENIIKEAINVSSFDRLKALSRVV